MDLQMNGLVVLYMKEHYYDKLLNIKTSGEQKVFNESNHYHPYEATPYVALEYLFEQYQVNSDDYVIDFGCGKGRLNFFIHYHFNVPVVGIEMNKHYHQQAIQNRYRYLQRKEVNEGTIMFHRCLAEEYEIGKQANRFYFFNPFSIQIFMRIIKNILKSKEQFPRQMDIILYYGSEEYLYFLTYQTQFELIKEVKLPEYEKNSYERFLIFRLN
jgi:SAM-dependent methyltransferase